MYTINQIGISYYKIPGTVTVIQDTLVLCIRDLMHNKVIAESNYHS